MPTTPNTNDLSDAEIASIRLALEVLNGLVPIWRQLGVTKWSVFAGIGEWFAQELAHLSPADREEFFRVWSQTALQRMAMRAAQLQEQQLHQAVVEAAGATKH